MTISCQNFIIVNAHTLIIVGQFWAWNFSFCLNWRTACKGISACRWKTWLVRWFSNRFNFWFSFCSFNCCNINVTTGTACCHVWKPLMTIGCQNFVIVNTHALVIVGQFWAWKLSFCLDWRTTCEGISACRWKVDGTCSGWFAFSRFAASSIIATFDTKVFFQTQAWIVNIFSFFTHIADVPCFWHVASWSFLTCLETHDKAIVMCIVFKPLASTWIFKQITRFIGQIKDQTSLMFTISRTSWVTVRSCLTITANIVIVKSLLIVIRTETTVWTSNIQTLVNHIVTKTNKSRLSCRILTWVIVLRKTMFFIDNDNIIVFTTNTVVRTVIGQFPCDLSFSDLRDCSCSFCDIGSLTIQHIVKMHRIGSSITLMTGCIYMNLIATVWLFVGMIPSKVVLAILIWPDWNTDFFNFFATT